MLFYAIDMYYISLRNFLNFIKEFEVLFGQRNLSIKFGIQSGKQTVSINNDILYLLLRLAEVITFALHLE